MPQKVLLHSGNPLICSWIYRWTQWKEWAIDRMNWLSKEEHQNRDAIQNEVAKERFLVTRTLWRLLLGQFLDISPEEVPLTHWPKGRPSLPGYPHVALSSSHSNEWVIFAMCPEGGQLGVDMEVVIPDFDYKQIMDAWFPLSVKQHIHNVEDFYRAWTLREAVAKARGTGLTEELLQMTDEALLPPHTRYGTRTLGNHCLISYVWWP